MAPAPERVLSQAIPRYPDAQRDLALVVARDVPAAEVEAVIRAQWRRAAARCAALRRLHRRGYPGGQEEPGVSLTYQSPERTLTDAEIEPAQEAVIAALAKRFGAELRS